MDTHPDPRRWDDVFDRTRKEIQNDIAACVESSVAVNSAVADIDFRQDGHADRKVYLRRATTYLPTIFTSQRIYVPDLRRSAAHRRNETSDLFHHWLHPTPLLKVTGTSLTSLANAPSGLTPSRSLARLHTESKPTYLTPSRGFIVG